MPSTTNRRIFLINSWILLFVLCAVKPQNLNEGLTSNEIDSLIENIIDPNSNCELHASALRNEFKRVLNNNLYDYDTSLLGENYFPLKSDEFNFFKKRYIGSLLKSGLVLPINQKRSLATLAKNGQLPTPESNSADLWNEKRNLPALVRSGKFLNSGKRNVGSLARDFQLPSSGKRNLSNLARLGLIPSAFDNDNYLTYLNQKRNLGALKGSPVHGTPQKRNKSSYYSLQNDYDDNNVNGMNYINFPEEKRFLGRILPPTRATSTTHRSRL